MWETQFVKFGSSHKEIQSLPDSLCVNAFAAGQQPGVREGVFRWNTEQGTRKQIEANAYRDCRYLGSSSSLPPLGETGDVQRRNPQDRT